MSAFILDLSFIPISAAQQEVMVETQSRPPAPPSPPSRPPPPNSSLRQQRSKVIDELLSTEKDFHHQMELCCTKVIPALKEVYGKKNLPQLELKESKKLAVPGPGFLCSSRICSLHGGCSSLISAPPAQTKHPELLPSDCQLFPFLFALLFLLSCCLHSSSTLCLFSSSISSSSSSSSSSSFAPSSLPPLSPSLPVLFFTFSLLL